jgi:hypothetical protein
MCIGPRAVKWMLHVAARWGTSEALPLRRRPVGAALLAAVFTVSTEE